MLPRYHFICRILTTSLSHLCNIYHCRNKLPNNGRKPVAPTVPKILQEFNVLLTEDGLPSHTPSHTTRRLSVVWFSKNLILFHAFTLC